MVLISLDKIVIYKPFYSITNSRNGKSMEPRYIFCAYPKLRSRFRSINVMVFVSGLRKRSLILFGKNMSKINFA